MTTFPFSQTERVQAISAKPQSRKELHKVLLQLGFKSVDDFYRFGRPGKIPPWQSINLVSIKLLLGDKDVYETEEDIQEGASTEWDKLVFSYLLPSLPFDHIAPAIEHIDAIARRFSLRLRWRDSDVDPLHLQHAWEQIAGDIQRQIGPVGSEEVAIVIETVHRQNYRPL